MQDKIKHQPALAGAFELLPKSYELIKKNFEVFMVLFAIGGLMALWETFARFDDEKEQGRGWDNLLANGVFGPDVSSGIFAVGGIMLIVLVLYVVSYLLLVIASLRTAQGKKPTIKSLWGELTHAWLWLKMIGGFISLVIAVVIGLIMLIVPGVVLVWRLFFVPYVLVDQKTSIKKAFKRSWDMTSGQAWPVYSVILVSILLSLASVLPIVGAIAAFLLSSAYAVAPALRYQEIKKHVK
ncbi:hypothetical protein H0X09_02855 [Candidatus Saccharibacteria bacterium]|nr:hypothetical protein [Candidatus Saccharibacteria bacterium]